MADKLSKKTLAASMAYTAQSLIGGGAIKGKNCTISSIEDITEGGTVVGQQVTFLWTLDDGTERTDTMNVMFGEPGDSVVSGEIDEEGHLILTMASGNTIDCGEISGQAQLSQSLTANVNIGSVTSGKTYPIGTNLEQIIRDMLISYNPPAIAISTTPSTRLYDAVNDSVSTILLKAQVTKKTDNVTKVSFLVGDTVVNEITSGVASGGNFQYQYTPANAITSDTTFKATATDGKQTSQSTFTIKFVGKSYYGICDASVSDPNETVIKSGSNVLKDIRNLTYSGITTAWGKVFYAYPKSFGALTYIKDEINNINYFDSFQRSEVSVDGIDYYCYTLIEPTGADDNQIVFK